MADNKWLTPNVESEQQKAARKRLAKEADAEIYKVVAMLKAEQAKKAAQPREPTPRAAPVPRTQPILIDEKPDPKVIAERAIPTAISEPPSAAEQQAAKPDPQLIELVRLYWKLSEHDKLELLLIARMKSYLRNRK